MRILGIDPSTVKTGWAIIDDGPKILASGVIKAGGSSRPARLASIDWQLRKIVKKWKPKEVAVEGGYVGFGKNRNPPAQLALAEARGVCVAVGAQGGRRVSYYSPSEVKLSVTGRGNADKAMVARVLHLRFGIAEFIDDNASDGIAVAITHHQRRS